MGEILHAASSYVDYQCDELDETKTESSNISFNRALTSHLSSQCTTQTNLALPIHYYAAPSPFHVTVCRTQAVLLNARS